MTLAAEPTHALVSTWDALQALKRRYPAAEDVEVDDLAALAINGEKGVIVVAGDGSIDIHLPTIRWVTPGLPEPSSDLWRSIPLAGLTLEALTSLVTRGLRARAAQYRRCRYCHQTFPPGHRHGTVCHSCAARHLGVVF